MNTGTKILIGAGVLVGGAGLYLLSRPAKAQPTLQPEPTKGKVAGGVFRLSATDAKRLACDLRAAKNSADVRVVLESLLKAVDDSGASKVDLQATGLAGPTMTVDEFRKEVAQISSAVSSVPSFLWGQAKTRIETTLSGLPDCDAPMQQWEAMFGGGSSGVQAAFRMPPFTLLQGLSPLRG